MRQGRRCGQPALRPGTTPARTQPCLAGLTCEFAHSRLQTYAPTRGTAMATKRLIMVKLKRVDKMIASGIDKDGESLRLLVAQALRAYPTPSLHPFLADKSVLVRSAAAREIQIRGESTSFDVAIRYVGDNRACVREVAIFILVQLGTPNYPFRAQSIPIISDRLVSDKSPAVRAAAAAALAHLNAHESLNALAEAVSGASAKVRACTAFALSNMKRRRKARELLSILKSDENVDVRFWADD